MSDNFHFDLTGVSLELCLTVAFGQHRSAVGWAELPVDGKDKTPAKVWGAGKGTPTRLVLFWTEDEGVVPFPSPMDPQQVYPMIRAWLDQPTRYGPQPDHDGDNSKGFRVYNEEWGHVAGKYQAFVAIEPIWLMHGK